MLVEDNVDDTFFITRHLRKGGVDQAVEVVTDGQKAIEYLAGCLECLVLEKGAFPGVIRLDLHLPRVNGFEVLEWMRAEAELAQIPAVVISSSSDERDQKLAYDLGARAYLVKYPSWEELSQVVLALRRGGALSGTL